MSIKQQFLDYLAEQFPATRGHVPIAAFMDKLVEKPEPAATTAEDRPHHPFSPSTLPNREWCPCYEGKQTDIPHPRTIAGTRAHGMVETGEDDTRLSDDDAVAAAECMDFVDQRRRLMESEANEAWVKAADNCGHVDNQPSKSQFQVSELTEEYLPVDDLIFPECTSTTAGYVDRVLINWNRTYAEIFDWKFGMWPVEGADNNLQGISYVLGLFRKFPTLQRVRFFFKQPLLNLTSDCEFTREQIPELYLRVQTVVARAREAKKAIVVNDWNLAHPAVPVCNFCSNLGKCTKVAAFACKVGSKFHPIDIPENITPSLIQDPTQTALGLRLAAVLKVWTEAFRRQVTDRILRGDAPIPAGQRIQEMAKRMLVDATKLKEVALKYLTTQEWEATLETTFGAVEERIAEHAPRGQKEATVKEFQQALLDSGAVKMGDKFSFLRAVPERKK
jgi:hypothetical protein